jgi:two-component system, sensor histidine kinase LadS
MFTRQGQGPLRSLCQMLLCLVVLGAFCAPVARAEQIESMALMSDHSARLEIESVVDMPFRPVSNTVTLGYSRAAQWLRVRIRPAPDGAEMVVLVRPPMLDNVTFYAPQAGTDGDGARTSFRRIDRDWPSSLRGYRITPPATGAEYYIRITSTGSIATSVTARTVPEAMRISLLTDLVQVGYFALMLVLLLWSLRLLRLTREKLFAWFAAMQAAWLFHNIISFGYAAILLQHVDQQSLTLVFRAAVIVTSVLTVLFHRAVLVRFKPRKPAVWMLDLVISAMLTAFVIFWTHDRQLALQINAYCIALTPFALFANAVTARTEASPGLARMRVIYVMLSLTILLWVFSLLGFAHISVVSLYGFMIHGVTTGILMFTILHLHARNLFAAAQKAEAQIAALDQQRAIQQERNRTLAQFIDMLSHEARNALAVINMSLSTPVLGARQRDRVNEAIVGLTGVIERCTQTVRLDNQHQSVTKTDCDLTDIFRKICSAHVDHARIHLQMPDRALLQSDPVLLGVVFGNLLDNALKYSPPASTVTATLDQGTEGISVTVTNHTGAFGAPDPRLAFGKYYRNQLAKAQIGSGLGLYIVRGLLDLLGGTITYEPTDGLVRFRVRFPC